MKKFTDTSSEFNLRNDFFRGNEVNVAGMLLRLLIVYWWLASCMITWDFPAHVFQGVCAEKRNFFARMGLEFS